MTDENLYPWRDDHAICVDSAGRIPLHMRTFDDVMENDYSDSDYRDRKNFFFRGTVRLKKCLNIARYQYRRGYHTGVSRIFDYGFSILQHETYLKTEYIDQVRCTIAACPTPEQREASINSWACRPRSLCPDVGKPIPFNINLGEWIINAIHADSDILGICVSDYAIVTLYSALLNCPGLDEDVRAEGTRFLTSFRLAMKGRCDEVEACGKGL